VTWPIRPAADDELDAVAALWTDAWIETHGPWMPAWMLRLRTPQSFRQRVGLMGDRLRVAGPPGAPLGMVAIREDELHQLFLAPAARGTGLAARLLADGEARMAAAGIAEAHLHCLPQNAAARRFYARHGWQDRGEQEVGIDGPDGPVPFTVAVFGKRLVP
jgi:GNAT superfamily N-acetyltransferase